MKRLLIGFVTFQFSLAGLAQHAQEPRTALVMGVGDYGGAKYKGKTVQNLPGILSADLPGMEAKLQALGFNVTVVSNPTLGQAKTAVDAFSARIKAAPAFRCSTSPATEGSQAIALSTSASVVFWCWLEARLLLFSFFALGLVAADHH